MKRILLISAAIPFAAGAAFAQASEQELREETIIVSTPGPERSAGEMISHVSVMDRDDLIADLSGTLGDTLDRQPGVSTTYFGAGASRPVLRGLGAERVLVLTNGLGAVDVSAASPDHQSTGDGIDAEAVEILRGPAALAYGGQAIGGVVNVLDGLIVDSLPEEGVSADLMAAGTTVNDGAELSGRTRFVKGPFVLTLTGSMRDASDYDIPGFAESAGFRALEEAEDHDHDHDEDDHDHDEDEHDHEGDEEHARDVLENSYLETQTLGAGLSWIGEDAFFGVSVRQTTSEYGLPGHSHDHGDEHDHEEEEDHDDHDHDEDEHEHEEGEEHAHEDPFIDLKQTRIDLKGGLLFDGGVVTKLEGALSYSDYEHTEFEAPGEPGTRYETDGVEGRLELDHTLGGFDGALGVQFSDISFAAFGEEAFIAPTDTTSYGVFLYETREWDDGFGVEGGLRLETVDYQNDRFGSRDFDMLSGSLGVHKHWTSGWFAGLQATYSERAPNQSELFADGLHLATDQYEVGDLGLDVEKATNLEATLRWESASTEVGASVFYTDFSDFIYLTPGETLQDGVLVDEIDETPVYLFRQEDAEFVGFEIYGEHRFDAAIAGAQWSVNGSLEYVEAELSNGENVPYLPPLTFNGELKADWGAYNLSLNTTLAGEQNDPGVGSLETDGYALFGLRGALDAATIFPGAQGVEIFADLRNLTDEEVRYSTSVLKDTLPAPGRNLRFGVKASF